MKITALDINHFMRVEAVHMDFDESGAITIAGENGSGKTSVETFLEMCFQGQIKCPAVPVKIGEEKAMGTITLDNEGTTVTIDAVVKEDGKLQLTVKQDGGKAIKSPVTMLKQLVSKFTFDPFYLMNLKGREQRKAMLECLGVDFDDLEAEAQEIKDEMAIVGRDRNGRERQLESLEVYKDVPAKEIKSAELSQELQDAIEHNDKVKEYHTAVDEWEEEIIYYRAEISKVQEQIIELRKKEKDLTAKLDESETYLEESKEVAATQELIDLEPIKKKINEVDEINEKVRKNKTRAELAVQYENDKENYRSLAKKLEEIERKKQDRLNNANSPIPDLEFRDDGVWYQGLPLDQDMESDQMIKCVQLAAALNPQLRVMCIDNGERLLDQKMQELNSWAKDNDYQILAFRASKESDGCEFYLVDGKVKE